MEQQIKDIINHQKSIDDDYVQKILDDDFIVTSQFVENDNHYVIVVHFDDKNQSEDEGQTYIIVATIDELGGKIDNVEEIIKEKLTRAVDNHTSVVKIEPEESEEAVDVPIVSVLNYEFLEAHQSETFNLNSCKVEVDSDISIDVKQNANSCNDIQVLRIKPEILPNDVDYTTMDYAIVDTNTINDGVDETVVGDENVVSDLVIDSDIDINLDGGIAKYSELQGIRAKALTIDADGNLRIEEVENEPTDVSVQYVFIDDVIDSMDSSHNIGDTIEIHGTNELAVVKKEDIQIVQSENNDDSDSVPVTKATGTSRALIKPKFNVTSNIEREKFGIYEEACNCKIVELSKEEQFEELLLRKNSTNYNNSKFKCSLCYLGFLAESTYRNHMEKHDPRYGEFECDVCHMRVQRSNMMPKHQARHKFRFHCRECNNVSKDWFQAQRHFEWHSGVKYICSQCGAIFEMRTSYFTHMRTHHSSAEARCEICGVTFMSPMGVIQHKNKAHRAKVDGRNEVAIATSSIEARGLYEMPASPSPPPAVSPAVSPPGRSRKCEVVRVSSAPSVIVAKKPRKPVLECPQCDHIAANAKEARLHRKIHGKVTTGETYYQCAYCEKTSTKKHLMQYHMHTHTNERPYQCSLCTKAFHSHPALHRHKRVHTGEKPYKCEICKKTFTQSNSKKLHVRTVHLKEPAPPRTPRPRKRPAPLLSFQ